MSSSFFLKGKSRQVHKIKGEKVKKKPRKHRENNLENEQDSSGSDLDFKKFSDAEVSDSDHETAEEKKLRIAKKYLEEIEKEEAKRAELKELSEDVIGKRLHKDYLEQKGKLHVDLADRLLAPSEDDIKLIRVKEQRLSLTCVCVSNDSQYVFTGSKDSAIVVFNMKEKRKQASITHKNNANVKGTITSLAVTTDCKFLASSDESSDIKIWDPLTLKLLHTFKGHKDTVTGLVFRKGTHFLYSSSKDRSVKIWSLDEMAYIETLFGHQSSIMSIDALTRERAITVGGRDTTVRIWKIVEESQLIFNGPSGSLDEVKLLSEEHFISGSDNGSICLWSVMKKKPLCTVSEAHGVENEVPRWITSLATYLNSDVFASGSYDNNIRLWKVCEGYRSISLLFCIKIEGFVNCLQFTSDGKKLYGAIGQEHKLGRWWRTTNAKNNLLIVNLNIKS